MSLTGTLRQDWLASPRADTLAGIVVALALIPEAIGFSIIAGVDPRVGLYASFSIAVIIAFTGGRPGMISAATAAVAVLVVPLVREHGVEYLFAATVLMGILQVIAGFLRLDLLMQYVSRSVITGFVNALAILIFMAQLPQLIDVPPVTYLLVAAGLAIIYLFPRLTRAIPSPLVAIVVLTALTLSLGIEINTVGDMGALPTTLPSFLIPDVPLHRRDPAHRSALFAGHGCRRAARVDDDRPDRRRPDRHALEQAARDEGSGDRQLRHGLLRRHGRLRDDRPVGDQREVGRLDAGSRPSSRVSSCSFSSSSSARWSPASRCRASWR